MKKSSKFLLVLLCLICLISCRREDLSIHQCEVQPYIKKDGLMGLSVYIYADIPDVSKTTMTVTDPSGKLVWTVNPSKAQFQGINYIGTSDITMPKGFSLPIGVWTVELIYKDGRTVKENIGVNYSDKDEFYNLNRDSNTVVFDSKYNLTLVP